MSQVIFDEVVNNIRAVDSEMTLSPAVMRQIVEACVRAVREHQDHEGRRKEEQSTDGAWSLQPRGER